MIHIKKQTHRSKGENAEPKNKPMNIWAINLRQRSQECTMESLQ